MDKIIEEDGYVPDLNRVEILSPDEFDRRRHVGLVENVQKQASGAIGAAIYSALNPEGQSYMSMGESPQPANPDSLAAEQSSPFK